MQVSLGVRSVRNICETREEKKLLRSYCEQLIKQYKNEGWKKVKKDEITEYVIAAERASLKRASEAAA
jgi:phosphoribosyl-ATP pyrophosphohydrolase